MKRLENNLWCIRLKNEKERNKVYFQVQRSQDKKQYASFAVREVWGKESSNKKENKTLASLSGELIMGGI